MTVRFELGDTRAVVNTIADGTVDLVLTSPPFLALRSYLPADHPDKALEIGSEPDPATFIDMLLELTADWRRVLAPHGSICVELGDTYSGSGGAGGDWSDSPATTKPRINGGGTGGPPRRDISSGWPLAKCKAMIPELYRIALAYGINPLTGRPSPAGRWRVRNVVTWCRPNPPVGALGDKYRPATSDMVIATVSPRRWFDLDAVRKAPSPNTHARVGKDRGERIGDDLPPSAHRDGNWSTLAANNEANPAGAPPLDYWVIPPTGYKGSHYAVYPPELCRIPIESMCPREVCTTCGEPRRRIARTTNAVGSRPPVSAGSGKAGIDTDAMGIRFDLNGAPDYAIRETLGWTDCGHDTWRPGLVLDPFGGSGTTGVAAQGAGRDATLIDLDARNIELARARIGLFLHEVERENERELRDNRVETSAQLAQLDMFGEVAL